MYAYFNLDHPMVAWEVAIGRVRSAASAERDEFGISLWAYSVLSSYARGWQTKRFLNELRLENVRRHTYPRQVSRLTGMYFFGSQELAEQAIVRWGIPSKFKAWISEVELVPSSLTSVDSEWISQNLGSSDESDWMNSYWRGEVSGQTPLTEMIATGQGYVLNKQLRIEAYKRIYDLWPTSTPLLGAACCAFATRCLQDVALVKPGLLSTKEGVQGNYFIYMKQFDDHQDDIVKAIQECRESAECPPMVLPSDGDIVFTLPDLRALSFELRDADSRDLLDSIATAT